MRMQDRIKRIRNKLGMTQAEFGVALGLSPTSAASWEKKDAQEPSNLVKGLMRKTFGININWLETGEGEMFDKANQPDETAKLIESVSGSPAMRSLLATWAQLSDENKAVFERFAADYVEDYNRRKAEAETARIEALLDEPEADGDISDNQSSVNHA